MREVFGEIYLNHGKKLYEFFSGGLPKNLNFKPMAFKKSKQTRTDKKKVETPRLLDTPPVLRPGGVH